MHRSRLAGFIIGCQTADLDGVVAFWTAQLGMPTRSLSGSEVEKDVRLEDGKRDLHVEVQKLDRPSRVYLDIEADDIEAEVARLYWTCVTDLQTV